MKKKILILQIIMLSLIIIGFPHINYFHTNLLHIKDADYSKENYGQSKLTLKGTYYGSISGVYGKKLYGATYPRIRVYRVYLSVGPHTISVSPSGPDNWDNPGIIIYDPSGSYFTSDCGNNGVTVNIYSSVSGYYYIVVYLTDDDGGDVNAMRFTLIVDGTTVAEDYVYGEDDESNPTIPYNSIAVFDLYSTVTRYEVSLLWGTTDNLDLYVFSEMSESMYYSAGILNPERILFDAEPNKHYTVLVHRYSAVSPTTDFEVNIVEKGCSLDIISPKNLTVVRGITEIKAKITRDEDIEVLNISLYVDDSYVENLTDYYNEAEDNVIYNWNTSEHSDGYHKVQLRLCYTYDSIAISVWKNISVLIDNIESKILLIDDEPLNMESYYINALESLGMSLHDEFEVWNTSIGLIDLHEFDIVIWLTGEEEEPISEEEMSTILKYMDSGGSILVSSKHLAKQWNNSRVFRNYFKAIYRGDPIWRQILFDDVESGNIGWTITGDWHITDSNYHSYNHCWYSGPYTNNANWILESPLLNLSGLKNASLKFWTRYDLEQNYDFGYVDVSSNGGLSWTTIAAYTGYHSSWSEFSYNITSYISSLFKIRFRLVSDSYFTQNGWWLDDIEIFGYTSLGMLSVNGTADSLYGIKLFNLYGNESTNTSKNSDGIDVLNNATAEMIYNGSTYYAALSYDGVYRLVYFAFPFESINSTTDRTYVMNKTLSFLNSSSGEQTSISSDDYFFIKVYDDLKISATLEASGTPLAGEEVYLYIYLKNGWKYVGKDETDGSGNAIILIKNISYLPGTYRIALVYHGNSTFAKSIKLATLSIRKLYNKIEVSYSSPIMDYGGYIMVLVRDENNNPYYTTVAITIMNNRFVAKTDEHGFANIFVKLPPGNYTAELIVYETDCILANYTTFPLEVEDDDVGKPMAELIDPPETVSYDSDLKIRASIYDATGIGTVLLYYKINDEEYKTKTMQYVGDGIWEAVIPKNEIAYGTVEWYITATDTDNDWSGDTSIGKSDVMITNVVDNDPPIITGYSISPVSPKIGDIISVKASVYEPADASGVDRVVVKISGSGISGEYNATFDGTSYGVNIEGLKAGSYICEIVAYDNAGNNATVKIEFNVSEIVTFRPTTEIEPLLYIGGSIVLVVAIVFVVYLLKIRRTKEE